MRVGIMYDGFSPFPGAIDLVRRADDLGLDSLWIAEHLLYRDAFGPAMAFLGETRHIAVVPTAVSPYARNPVLIAMGLATLAERGPGRVRAVLATGQPDDLKAVGLNPTRPLETMKEALGAVRSALAGEPLKHRGRDFPVRDRRLGFAPPAPIPLYLAAMGPRMSRLAGNHADGALFSGGSSPAYIRWGAESVAQGARDAGRDPKEAAIASVIVGSMSSERETAYRAVRRTLAFILRGPHHDRNRELAGTKLDRQALAEAVSQGDWARAEGLIDDEVVRNHSVSGDAREFLGRLAEFAEAGLDVAVLLLQGAPEDRMRAVEAAARI
ncbi:MAG: LLM class flavin-dependent oxidoreductase [Nitrospinota bacterium]